MENNYGVAVSNRYDLFLDEDADPLAILSVRDEGKVKAVKEKKPVPPPAAPAKDVKNKVTKAPVKKSDEVRKPPRQTPAQSESDWGEAAKNRPDPGRMRVGRWQDNENAAKPPRQEYGGGDKRPRDRDRDRDRDRERDRDENRENRNYGGGDARDRNFGGEGRGNYGEGRNLEDGGYRGGRGGGAGRGGRGSFRGRGGGGPRGRGGGRGRGGIGGNFDGRGKREFERHSGTEETGIKAVEKRDGGGGQNWGRATDNFETEWTPNEEPVNGSAEPESSKQQGANENKEATDENTEVKEAVTEEKTEEEKNAEAQEKQFTLDEWKALQAAEKRERPQFKIRRPGEGEDPKQWKNTFVLKKKEPLSNDEKSHEEDEDEEDDDKTERLQSLAHLIPIVFASGPARRGGGGRGRGRGLPRGAGGPRDSRERDGRDRDGGGGPPYARGGGRRFGSRGAGFSTRGNDVQSAPKVDDEYDFPSL